ncbi:MAG TPA: winged helix DNA-binding protein [Lachnospiraceae bacterium]|nr:winged helix DNA-binding protein [Lachnospiraceae bacterium]
MDRECKKAQRLAEVWHRLLQNPKNNICTEKLKAASILDVNILRVINEGEKVIIRDIGNALSVGPSTLSSAIKRLEKMGLIERLLCENDLRSYSVKLTMEGKKELEHHAQKEIAVMQGLLGKLDSKEEQEQLLCLLDKLLR